MNLLDNTSNQLSKFRTKNWVEINDDRNGTCDKTIMLNASLRDYSDAYILVEGRIIVVGQGADDAAIAAERNDIKTWFLKTVHHLLSV